MFPAIKQALAPVADGWREFRNGFGASPEPLELKETIATFDPVSVQFYRKYPRIWAAISGGDPAWSGEFVSNESMLSHSVAWACRRIITESVAFMPLNMMIDRGEEGKFAAKQKPLYNALKSAPNEDMTSMAFRECLTDHMITWGTAYAQIIRRSGSNEAIALYPITPDRVRSDRDQQKRLVHIVSGDGPEKTYTVEAGKPHDILHIPGLSYDGIKGYSVLSVARNSVGLALSQERYASHYFSRGARQPGYLKPERQFKTEQESKAFEDDLNKHFDSESYHKYPIFPMGVEFKPFGSWSPSDSQLLESRGLTVSDICRWFLISPDMVGDMSKATLNNMEQLALRFVKMTLTAWITRWEQNLWRCVLTPEEKAGGYYFKHNVNGLLRGDFQTRMAGYASALQNGFKNIDEVRDLEDDNPLPDGAGKAHHIQLNMGTVPGTGSPMIAEQAMLAKTRTSAEVMNMAFMEVRDAD